MIIGPLAAAALLFAAFIERERRAPTPMLDLSLFSKANFGAGVASGLLSYLVLFGTLTVVPFLLEITHRQSTGAAGAETSSCHSASAS